MAVSRRLLLALPALVLTARAPAARAQVPERALGSPTAKVTVQEFFSLTCSHCAAFHRDTFPRVKSELIDTDRVRFVFQDFPLDQVALNAALVARSLPSERYVPFISALLASQDRWAFARGVDSTEELAKMAALAGMPRQAFNAALGDDKLKAAILGAQSEAEKRNRIQSTPSFVINGRTVAGAMSYDAFLKQVEQAA